MGPVTTLAARNSVTAVFFLNGLLFSSWISRIPEARSELGLGNGQLGLLLLAIAVGSVISLPTTGPAIERFGTVAVTRFGAAAGLVSFAVITVALTAGSVWVAAPALFVYGVGTGTWDVAMNVEGAAVERQLGRTIMPRFHAAFSLGTVVGSGLGAALVGLGTPVWGHLPLIGVAGAVGVVAATRRFLPDEVVEDADEPRVSPWAAWKEPTTLLIGLMVLALALTEGTANDWLALALVDGYDVPRWVGVAGFALFVTAMTIGRVSGTVLLDRFGRVPVLWATMVAAAGGILLIAFLAGPPLLGFVADHVGTLKALLVVAVVLIPSALVVPSAREKGRARAGV
jgi:MFS family permease